jgi:homeobox protein ESX1
MGGMTETQQEASLIGSQPTLAMGSQAQVPIPPDGPPIPVPPVPTPPPTPEIPDPPVQEPPGPDSPDPTGPNGPPVGDPPAERPVRMQRLPREIGGPAGPEPTRYGDWERNGRAFDF